MYQVGFGDCFLLSFSYRTALPDGRRERHVLVDFGSTRWPKDYSPRYRDIATDIAARTGGKLDVLVVTHRHKDHLGGFGDDIATATIAALRPSLVLRSWTENPEAAANATGPALVGQRSLAYADGLATAQVFASEVARTLRGQQHGFRAELAEMAIEQLANQDAVRHLDDLAAAPGAAARYLHAGQPSGIDALIPGVTTKVLGPPTVDQWPAVAGQRDDDPDYWLRQHGVLASMLKNVDAPPALVRVANGSRGGRRQTIDPGPLRWIVDRMRDQQTHSLLRIVRSLENALNNTSIIVQVQSGTRRLLFPGDAQIENWSYTLTSPRATALRADLARIDLYKVGHHGSRNATPRSLVKRWQAHGRPFVSMLSTLPGVHGETEATAVPRATLVQALEGLGALYRTDGLDPAVMSTAVTASTRDRYAFAPAAGSYPEGSVRRRDAEEAVDLVGFGHDRAGQHDRFVQVGVEVGGPVHRRHRRCGRRWRREPLRVAAEQDVPAQPTRSPPHRQDRVGPARAPGSSGAPLRVQPPGARASRPGRRRDRRASASAPGGHAGAVARRASGRTLAPRVSAPAAGLAPGRRRSGRPARPSRGPARTRSSSTSSGTPRAQRSTSSSSSCSGVVLTTRATPSGAV